MKILILDSESVCFRYLNNPFIRDRRFHYEILKKVIYVYRSGAVRGSNLKSYIRLIKISGRSKTFKITLTSAEISKVNTIFTEKEIAFENVEEEKERFREFS